MSWPVSASVFSPVPSWRCGSSLQPYLQHDPNKNGHRRWPFSCCAHEALATSSFRRFRQRPQVGHDTLEFAFAQFLHKRRHPAFAMSNGAGELIVRFARVPGWVCEGRDHADARPISAFAIDAVTLGALVYEDLATQFWIACFPIPLGECVFRVRGARPAGASLFGFVGLICRKRPRFLRGGAQKRLACARSLVLILESLSPDWVFADGFGRRLGRRHVAACRRNRDASPEQGPRELSHRQTPKCKEIQGSLSRPRSIQQKTLGPDPSAACRVVFPSARCQPKCVWATKHTLGVKL